MFNVAVLKMKDIIKYSIGIILTVLIVTVISKYFNKDTSNEEKLIENIKSGVKSLSQNSMLSCLDQTIPTVADINEEYRNISKEDDKTKNSNMLQEMLKTQISSIKGVETAEEKSTEEQEKVNENNEQKNDNENNKENIQIARNRVTNTSNYK